MSLIHDSGEYFAWLKDRDASTEFKQKFYLSNPFDRQPRNKNIKCCR